MYRSGYQAGLALAVLLLLLTTTSALGQERALDVIQPFLQRHDFQTLCQTLEMDRDQRIVLDLFYRDYADAIIALAERTDAAAEQAGRSTVERALRGGIILRPEELRDLRVAVQQAYQRAWPEADRLLDDLLMNVRVQLLPEQEARFDDALRRAHRAMWLHPRQAGRTDYDYAGDGIDLLQIAGEEHDGGLLATLPDSHLTPVLETYELALDALLLADARDDRDGRMVLRLAQINRDSSAIRLAQEAHLERWQRLHELNAATARSIAQLLEQADGEPAAQGWLDRYERAIFPWLNRQAGPDYQYQWIEQAELSADVTSKSSTIYASYVNTRRALRRQASSLMLGARVQESVVVHPMLDATANLVSAARAPYEELVRISGELELLDRDAAAALSDLLNEDQRRQMEKWVRRARR